MVEEAKLVETDSGLKRSPRQGGSSSTRATPPGGVIATSSGYGCPFGSRDVGLFPRARRSALRVLAAGRARTVATTARRTGGLPRPLGRVPAARRGRGAARSKHGTSFTAPPGRAHRRRCRLGPVRDPDGRCEAGRGHPLPRRRGRAEARRRRRDGDERAARGVRRPALRRGKRLPLEDAGLPWQ